MFKYAVTCTEGLFQNQSDESENIYSNVGSTVRNDSFGIKVWKLSN